MKTGLIGLGAMGQSMARNLARHGRLAGVWNRSVDKARTLAVETGCHVAADPAELARTCEAVVICVSADADVKSVVAALQPGLSAGQLVIDCSTVSAETARQCAQRLGQQRVDFLDAPVSGGTEGARLGTLSIMVGGEAHAFERALPVLRALGQRIVHLGPAGSGQAAKAVNQVMAAGINQAVTEAMAFAQALGLPLEKLIEVIGSGAAGNWFVNHRGLSMVEGRYPPGFKLALHHKDLSICLAMAAQLGGELPLSAQTRADYERLMAAGHGDEDISALYRLKREI
ncbi:MAG TPA: NAD(P)-dependent oxidoreductase, partial [Nevskiales bacterium]|nr:NAD(P)-dependent oxidoreductase [Nevskiales bacterium]